MNDLPLALHNPAMLPPAVLLDEFTARRDLLSRILDMIGSNDPGDPPQHALLLGPRGMGKSTTLLAVAHSIALRETKLRKMWQPVIFDEESRRVGDLADFWLECIRQWETMTASQEHLEDTLLDSAPEEIENLAREGFLNLVDQSGKRALLLIDNIDTIFSSIREEGPLHRLRAFLMEDDRIMILGAATRSFSDITSLDKPFFEFFRIFDLKPLSFEEMKTCLEGLAISRADKGVMETIASRTGSLRSIHLLTGGNPRLIKTFYRLLKDGFHEDIRLELEQLLDEFTPYFKATVDALSVQQQRIFDAVALSWNPVEVAHISRQTRLPSNQVSAQLKSMVKSGHVAEVLAHPKRKSYLLADRFSNIHYLMRHGRVARIRFDWFVVMIRLLFEDEDFARNIANLAKKAALKGGEGWKDACDLVANAAHRADTDEARKHLLDKLAWGGVSDTIIELSLAETACRSIIQENPGDAHAHYKLGCVFELKHGDYQSAAKKYREAIRLDPDHLPAWASLGWVCHRRLHRPKEAANAYKMALKIDPKAYWVWNNFGSFHQEVTGKYSEAENAFRRAIETKQETAATWYNLGNLKQDFLNELDEAEACYQESLRTNDAYGPAYIGLARLYHRKGLDRTLYVPLAKKAVSLEPKLGYIHMQFFRLCGNDAAAIADVLPNLCRWCAENPHHLDLPRLVSFAVSLWVRFSALRSNKEALQLLQGLPETTRTPFEHLADAFYALEDATYLQRIAPERASLATEIVRILSPATPKKKPKGRLSIPGRDRRVPSWSRPG